MLDRLASMLAVIAAFLVLQSTAMAGDCLDDLRKQLEPTISSKVPATLGIQAIFAGALNADTSNQYLAFVTMSKGWSKGCDSEKISTTRTFNIWVREDSLSAWIAKGSVEIWPVDTFGHVETDVSVKNNVLTVNQNSHLGRVNFFDAMKFRYRDGQFQIIGWDQSDRYMDNAGGGYSEVQEQSYDAAVKKNPGRKISDSTGYTASANYLTGRGWFEKFEYAGRPVKKEVRFSNKPIYLNDLKSYPFPIN
jgi:hypothetical protein